jgi:hypothetical protein
MTDWYRKCLVQLLEKDEKFYRMRRGELVEIPPKMGRADSSSAKYKEALIEEWTRT